MALKQLLEQRYATKKFSGEAIPQEKVDELLELIKLAPSSFGLQTFRVVVIQNPELQEKLKAASWGQAQITTCSHLLVFCADNNVSERIEQYEQLMIDNGADKENISGYIQSMRDSVGKLDAQSATTWSQKQIYIALENALLGAKELGYDSCPMEGFDAKAYAEILELPENLTPTVLCPIGIAADEAHPKLRFNDLFITK